MDKKLSLMAGRAVPKFVREDYPQFMNFVKGYFEFLEREGGEYAIVAEMIDAVDIDKTVDEYIHYYRNEMLPGFPDRLAVDAKFLIKKIKDFYQAKGTEESFEFLFRTLFDSPIRFYYPKVDMLRVSEGAWVEPYYIFPEKLNAGDTNPDLFALRDQKIQGKTSGATAYIDDRILITVPKENDPDNVALKFGSSLSEVQGEFTAGEECRVISSRFDDLGNALPALPDFKILETYEGKSGIIRPNGRYMDNQGFLSDTKKIQDSYYYQDFSYELISEIPVKFYDQVIKRLVHPAGFAMFGKVEVKSIDVISLRDLVAYFEILIAWENILVDAGLIDNGGDSNILVTTDPSPSVSQRTDWNHFVEMRETDQYDVLRNDELDLFTFDELDDLRGRNYHMVFVDYKKVPYNQYTVTDREVVFNTAPTAATTTNVMLKKNIEILHLAYSLQEPMVFDANGVDVEYDLNDNLNITESNIRSSLVFVDGLFQDYGIHYSIVENVRNTTKYSIVFKSILAADTTIDISLLGGNAVPGLNYAPRRDYTDLTADKFEHPVRLMHMPDSRESNEIAIFANGYKMPHKLAYSVIDDIETGEVLIMPRIKPADVGIPAPINLSSFTLKDAMIDSDLHSADGTTKNFSMMISHNHFDIQQSAIIDEHEYVKPTVGEHGVDFSRTSTSTSDVFNDYPIWHDFMAQGQTEIAIEKDLSKWVSSGTRRIFQNTSHGRAERFDSTNANGTAMSSSGNYRYYDIANNLIPDGKYVTFQMWVYQSNDNNANGESIRLEYASRATIHCSRSHRGRWQLVTATYKHESSNTSKLRILMYPVLSKSMVGYMLFADPKVFVHDTAVPPAPTEKVELYMNIDIKERSIYFNNWKIGVKPNDFMVESNQTETLDVGKYLYNKQFTVNDVSKPLNIQVGHFKGSIRDITLSVIDD